MEKIILDIHEDVVSAIEKIKRIKDKEVELEIPEGSVLLENSLNLRLIRKEAKKLDKNINFQTTDPEGLIILDIIDEGATSAVGSVGVGEDFVSREVSLNEIVGSKRKKREKRGPFAFLSGLSLPKFNFNLPSFSFGNNGILIGLIGVIALLGLGYGALRLYWSTLEAEVKIEVSSQPLVESMQIAVGTGLENNIEEGTMKGQVFAASTTKSKSTETTGTKLVGETATGRVEIINKTDVETTFDSGTEIYSEDDSNLVYTLDGDVTVPPREAEDPDDPGSPLIPGRAEVDVTAEDIGDDYNLDEGEVLEFEEYSSSNYVARVAEDIDGGFVETISIVAQKDLDAISEALLNQIQTENPDRVKELVEDGWVYINNSQSSELTEEEFSHSVGDETDEVSVTQSVIFRGLAYNEDDLRELVKPKLEERVPDGFELSSEKIDINVEILGNTNETVLSTTEADLQVTVKSHIIPEIDEEKIQKELAGVSLTQAREILNGIRNVQNYSLSTNHGIPVLNRMPQNSDNITIVIERI